MIPTTGKSYYIYNSILEDVKKILIDHKIDIDKIPKRIILDFESGLQKAVQKNFPDFVIDGCYFHYMKLLWKQAKLFGLCKKGDIKKNQNFNIYIKNFTFYKRG